MAAVASAGATTVRPDHARAHAVVHMLFWTGMRPSEVAGLQGGDIDIAKGCLTVRRSRRLYEDGAPKTAKAERTLHVSPEGIRLLVNIQPRRVEPAARVFTTTEGRPIEPKAFVSCYRYRCLRALGLQQRGIYAAKDTPSLGNLDDS